MLEPKQVGRRQDDIGHRDQERGGAERCRRELPRKIQQRRHPVSVQNRDTSRREGPQTLARVRPVCLRVEEIVDHIDAGCQQAEGEDGWKENTDKCLRRELADQR